MMKPGDLIRDLSDGELGLVLSEPRSYDLTRGREEEYREYVYVQWPSYDEQSRVVLTAIRKGWIEIVNKAEETTNR